MWKNHFCNVLNANVCDSDLKYDVMVEHENIQHTNDMTVSARDVSELLIICGKAATARAIVLATIMSKLFESVILLIKCEMFLDTCPNQIGFKIKGHSTGNVHAFMF